MYEKTLSHDPQSRWSVYKQVMFNVLGGFDIRQLASSCNTTLRAFEKYEDSSSGVSALPRNRAIYSLDDIIPE